MQSNARVAPADVPDKLISTVGPLAVNATAEAFCEFKDVVKQHIFRGLPQGGG